MAKSTQILKAISQLILSVENSSIQKTDKLKLVKVLFAIKLKLIELLEKELKMEAKLIYRASPHAKRVYETLSQISEANTHYGVVASVAKSSDESIKVSDKQDLIIQFIKDNRGRVNAVDLLSLGIAGRSLRRYIKNLIDRRKIKIEKSGRNYFYLLA